MDGRAHETLATRRYAITPGARDLRHQPVRPQQTDPTADAPALSASLDRVARLGPEQLRRQLTIAKATHGVLTTQRSLKQGLIVASQRLQAATSPPLIRDR